MTYYLKKLGHQELGSIKYSGDKPSRGRYIYISKDLSVLSFFPPLSKTVKNDSSLLPIVPLYMEHPEKVYCNYIYHNDKYHGSTASSPRNEFRIYTNNALEMDQFLFEKDDIFILKKDEIVTKDDRQQIYYLELVSDHQSPLYAMCLNIINDSSVRGNHAIYNGVIEEMESKINRISNKDALPTVVDSTVTNKVESSDTKLEDLFNSTSFRDFVMVGYENLCAVTRSVIKYENFLNLEAAHIRPKSHGGQFMPNNGMALSRDIHWAFDKGFFSINDDYTIIVHSEVQSDYLKSFEGKKIHIPENAFFIPDISNLKYHRENIYGLFLTSGRL